MSRFIIFRGKWPRSPTRTALEIAFEIYAFRFVLKILLL